MKNIQELLAWYSTHPWHKRDFAKLRASDIEIVLGFFAREYADKHEAMRACNRMFVDKPDKPKEWTRISQAVCSMIVHRYQ